MDSSAKVFGIKIDTRARRRWTVLAMYASYIVGSIFAHASRNNSGLELQLSLALVWVPFFITGACWLALAQLLREYGFPGDSRVFTSRDERQTSVRHRAFVRAYQILVPVVCAGVLYVTLASENGLWLPTGTYVKAIAFGLVLLCTSFPSAVIAWTEPDLASESIPSDGSPLRA